MKIYSWNMLCRNKELDRAFEFVSKSDFDIFCLQEVPEKFLQCLHALPYFISFRSERELLYPQSSVHNYVVILSKHPIISEGEIPFPEYWQLLPLRTRIFVRFMPSQLFTKIRNRSAQYIDITVQGMSLRVFNLHLILAQPAWRLEEFKTAMIQQDRSRSTIVCGDFNILEKPYITPLNWILGGRISDALLYRRERTAIEKCFAANELLNPLRGKSTHQISRSQLDHILLSPDFSIKNASVIPDRVGSDHHPILIEIA